MTLMRLTLIWSNVVVLFQDKNPDKIVTVDLELDLKARPDLSIEEFDLDEFLEAKQRYGYPDWLERRVKLAALEVRDLLSRAQWPVLGAQALDPKFVWLDRLPPTEG